MDVGAARTRDGGARRGRARSAPAVRDGGTDLAARAAGACRQRAAEGMIRPIVPQTTTVNATTFESARSILFQSPQHLFELIEAAIVNVYHAAFAAVIERDGKSQRVRYPPLERNRIGVFHRALLDRLARSRRAILRQRLDLTNVEPAIDDLARHLFGIGRADEHARGAGRDLASMDVSLDRLRQLQQPQRVGDVTATLADDLGDVLVAVAVLAC